MKEKHKTNKQSQERTRGDRCYSERVRGKRFSCTFKLGFLQLMCKASFIFKLNLELALSIIFKTKIIIWVKACCGGV